MSNWRFLYDPDSDSWEIVTNQAFATKKDAEDYIEDIERRESEVDE